jgi:hypothetical protein
MKNNYQLVNPYIVGDFKSVVSADSSNSAADKLWENLSKHSKLYTDKFLFTIQSLKSGEMYHYSVAETANNNGIVDYKLSLLDNIDIPKKHKSMFQKRINYLQNGGQKGGSKRYRNYGDDDDDDDLEDKDDELYSLFEDDELYRMVRRNKYSHLTPLGTPFLYMWYDPLVYATNTIYHAVNIPVLTYPHTVRINLSSSTWGLLHERP